MSDDDLDDFEAVDNKPAVISLLGKDDRSSGFRFFICIQGLTEVREGETTLFITREHDPRYLGEDGWEDTPQTLTPLGVYTREGDLYLEVPASLEVDDFELVKVGLNGNDHVGVLSWEAKPFELEKHAEPENLVNSRPPEFAIDSADKSKSESKTDVSDNGADGAPEDLEYRTDTTIAGDQNDSKRLRIAGIAVLAVLLSVLAGIGLYYLIRSDDNSQGQKIDEGKIDEGKIDEGKIDEGKVDEGKIDEGKVDEGKIDEGKIDEGKVDEGKVNEGKVDDGKVDEDDTVESRKDSGDLINDFRTSLSSEDFDRARLLLKRLTEARDPEAALIAGELAGGPNFKEGLFKDRNEFDALDYFEMACKAGAQDRAIPALEALNEALVQEGDKDGGLTSTSETLIYESIPSLLRRCGK